MSKKNNNKETITATTGWKTRYRSILHIDDQMIMYRPKHYGWFRRLMFKFFFDIKIENVDIEM